MAPSTWVVSSPWAKEHYGRGLEAGRAEGVAAGEVKGKAEGISEAMLIFMEARGIPAPDPVRDRIKRCTDLYLLLAWARRAATVDDAEAIFGD